MINIRILVTAAGAPGTSTLIKQLIHPEEYAVNTVIAVDSNECVGGRFIADKFYRVPPVSDEEGYIDNLLQIIIKEDIGVLFPVSEIESRVIANHINIFSMHCDVIVNDSTTFNRVLDKANLYTIAKNKGIPIPKFYLPKNLDEFCEYSEKLGYPNKPVCFKPYTSKGGRGFRILDLSINKADLLLNHKPESIYMSRKEFIEIFEYEKNFPDLILMEVVEGTNYDAMVLGNGKESLLTTVKTRENARWGTIVQGELIYSEEHIRLCNYITKVFGLKYNNSIQFIDDKLIEINPRTSTYIYSKNFNEPWLSVKLIRGLITDKEIKKYMNKIPYGLRLCRYMDQISYRNN